MQRKIVIEEGYLYIPVYKEKDLECITFSVQREKGKEKVMEFMIPVDKSREEEYSGDYYAEIPVHKYAGETLLIEGNYPAIMGMRIENTKKRLQYISGRPRIHFTPNRGWSNDPNGMVYRDGIYHLYFQYNPFNTQWENMSWGHAVSRDLLHWAQLNTVLFPDEDGTMFSGCGLVNDRELLDLPEDALLFFYTEAGSTSKWSEGKEFTQKIAYSLDMGETLHKIANPCIDTLYYENRDPKIFWHEETQAYVMVLWLRGNAFGILRSNDLEHWDLQQEIQLEEGWECPDLFCLENEEGEKRWFFWTADGHYYPGEFDGYHFTMSGERHKAYITGIPYAAQTFSGVEGRTISIPWLRLENDGRLFTGAYGIPTEFSWKKIDDFYYIQQKPVREFYKNLQPLKEDLLNISGNKVIYTGPSKGHALYCKVEIDSHCRHNYCFEINGTQVEYRPSSGDIAIDNVKSQAGLEFSQVEFIVDDNILEVIFDGGRAMGTFSLKQRELSFTMDTNKISKYEFSVVE